MKILNRLLHRQIGKYFGSIENVPVEIRPFLEIISDTYDHDEKDRKMLERSIELSSGEMKELNNKLRIENEENNKIIFDKLNESLSLHNKESIGGHQPKDVDFITLSHVADLLKQEINERRIAEEKIIQANRMYAFTSQINQTIVHVKDEQTLFTEACRIAINVGKFELACIDIIDEGNSVLNLVAYASAQRTDKVKNKSLLYPENGIIKKILQNDKYYVINDCSDENDEDLIRQFTFLKEYQSAIFLPLKKAGKILCVFSLFSKKANFFSDEEKTLLSEVAIDISFTLNVLEKEKQRKRFEEKIKNNELRLKQAQKMAHFGSWNLNFSTGIAHWSEEACRIYGLSTDDDTHTYESWLSFIHPDDFEYVIKVIKENEVALKSQNIFHRIVRKDGAVRYVHSYTEFEFRNNKPVGIYGVVDDITEIKEVENNLKQSKANLRQIVDLMPQSIFAMNADGKFLFANKSFAKLYGYTPKELVNKFIHETIPDKNKSDFYVEQAREVIHTGLTQIIPETIFTDHTGKSKFFHSTKVPYNPAGKNEMAMLGISLDITEQKKADMERAKMISDIVQRNKDLEQFTYIVSHNLRAPLANIIGLADLMQILEPSKVEEKVMMSELLYSVKNLDTVIKDLNYVLQIKHEVNERKEIVNYSELCEDIKSSIINLFKNKEVQIICDFSAIGEMLTLKSYLYSIFFNLISNSIKYHKPGLKPVIEITSRKEHNDIVLIFKDNGLGIDLKQKGDQIFGLYKRFHNHTEGKGMGLYMVKTQVETLGGKITVESEVNKGSTFNITFNNILNT